MKKKDLYFLAMAVFVIGLFIFLSLVGRKAKPMTARAEHAAVTRDTPRETCWGCHGDETTVAPLPVRHPKKGKPPDQTTPCHVCHKLPDAPVALFRLNSHRPREGQFSWLSRNQK
ncbi:MAG TPA: hypothetical protein VJQ56_09750 [Blastocatellia bacterium]|nr:hypothetical protein [Blastocatellia bacterium]